MAGRVIDPAFEAAASVNFWVMQSLYIPFEITAVNGMIHFWRDDYSPAITFCIQIAIYAAINLYAVRVFGECEFWFSLAKLILCIGLLFFTLVTMCGVILNMMPLVSVTGMRLVAPSPRYIPLDH